MAKNYMQDVAKMLGVELGEEFMIEDADGNLIDTNVYSLTEIGCFYSTNKNDISAGNGSLLGILQGIFKIRKLPWQPKKGEAYCRPMDGFEDVDFDNWSNHPIDFALKEAGMIFKTKEECEAALPELRKKYLGGDVHADDAEVPYCWHCGAVMDEVMKK